MPDQDKTFGGLLRTARSQAGMTQYALAVEVEKILQDTSESTQAVIVSQNNQSKLNRKNSVSIQAVSLWENNYNKPNREKVVALIQVLVKKKGIVDLETANTLLKSVGFSELNSDEQKAFNLYHQEKSVTSPDDRTTQIARPYQLPPPIDDFTGRIDDIADAEKYLRTASIEQHITPIYYISGMPGVGKSTLAIHIAYKVCDLFPYAQIVRDLRGSQDEPATTVNILQTIIRDLLPTAKIPEEEADLIKMYRSVLHHQRALILADDAKDSAQLEPLKPPPGSALLVTSRSRFGNTGKHWTDIGELSKEDAVVLLQKINPTISHVSASVLAQLCGYLPLALRITASLTCRDRVHTIDEYIALLQDERLVLEQMKHENLSVEASLSLSYKILTSVEQEVFTQLGIFRTSFSRNAALHVLIPSEANNLLDVLSRLDQASLLEIDPQQHYHLHELVRVFALNRLKASPERYHQTWQRYLAYYLSLAETDVPDEGTGLQRWLQSMDAERAHFDDIFSHADDRTLVSPANALRMVAALGRFWYQRGYYKEGLQRLVSVLERSDTSAPALLMVRRQALVWAGAIAVDQSEYPKAIEWLTEALAYKETPADTLDVARVHLNLANALSGRNKDGDIDQAKAHYTQATERATFMQNQQLLRRIMLNKAAAPFITLTEALEARREAVEVYHDVFDRNHAIALNNYGQALRFNNNYVLARKYLNESKDLHLRMGNTWGVASAVSDIGWVDYYEHHDAQAMKHFFESLKRHTENEDTETLAWNLEGIAGIAIRNGWIDVAARLLGHVKHLRKDDITLMDWEQEEYTVIEQHARAEIDAIAFKQLFAEGEAMPTTSALELVDNFNMQINTTS